MGLIEVIKKAFRRTPKLSDRDRVRNIIVKEIAYSTALAGFLCKAHNLGHGVRITVGVDGHECGVAILAHAKEPLVEYLANWACAEKIKKELRLDEFDKDGGGAESVSGPVDNPHAVNYEPRSKNRADYFGDMGA